MSFLPWILIGHYGVPDAQHLKTRADLSLHVMHNIFKQKDGLHGSAYKNNIKNIKETNKVTNNSF